MIDVARSNIAEPSRGVMWGARAVRPTGVCFERLMGVLPAPSAATGRSAGWPHGRRPRCLAGAAYAPTVESCRGHRCARVSEHVVPCFVPGTAPRRSPRRAVSQNSCIAMMIVRTRWLRGSLRLDHGAPKAGARVICREHEAFGAPDRRRSVGCGAARKASHQDSCCRRTWPRFGFGAGRAGVPGNAPPTSQWRDSGSPT
jgi:hypothetical protein